MTAPIPQQRAMTGAEWLMLLALSVLWGCSFLFSKIAVAEIPPFTLVFGRVALASLTLAAAMRLMGVPLPRGRVLWLNLLGMGMLNNIIPFSLMFWGQTQIGAGLASILNATTPIFTVLVAHALTRDEKLTLSRGVGVLLGFLGVVVMPGPELFTGLDRAVLAEIACLGGALSYAFSSVFGRRFARMGVKPAQAAFGQLTASAVVMMPVSLLVDQPWTLPMPSMQALACLLALALLSTALAYILFFRILGSAGATNIMLVTFLIPPSAIMLGAVVLGERLAALDFAGLALIALGLAAIDRRSAAFATRFWRTGKRVPNGSMSAQAAAKGRKISTTRS